MNHKQDNVLSWQIWKLKKSNKPTSEKSDFAVAEDECPWSKE